MKNKILKALLCALVIAPTLVRADTMDDREKYYGVERYHTLSQSELELKSDADLKILQREISKLKTAANRTLLKTRLLATQNAAVLVIEADAGIAAASAGVYFALRNTKLCKGEYAECLVFTSMMAGLGTIATFMAAATSGNEIDNYSYSIERLKEFNRDFARSVTKLDDSLNDIDTILIARKYSKK